MVVLLNFSDSRDANIVNKCFMENREQQILSEIKAMMGTIRSQLELLDAKMVELQQCVDPEEFDNNPIEVDIDLSVEDDSVVQVLADDDDLPFGDLPSSEVTPEPEMPSQFESAPESAPESEPESVSEPVLEAEQESEQEEEQEVEQEFSAEEVEEGKEEDDDLPGVFDQPIPLYAAAQSSPKVKPSVAEVMADEQPWRTDMPGTPVKDVRSAISLNDRIIFINQLFSEDPIKFQNDITQINTLTTLDQVVDYLSSNHPDWDFNSELVYRFMMAIRRRVK